MRIAICGRGIDTPGGINTVVNKDAAVLLNSNIEYKIFLLPVYRKQERNKYYNQIADIKDKIFEYNPSVFHFHLSSPEDYLPYLPIFNKYPVVVTVHTNIFHCPGYVKLKRKSDILCNQAYSINCLIKAFSENCNIHDVTELVFRYRGTGKTQRYLSKANRIVVLSDYIAQNLKTCGIDTKKIKIVKIYVNNPIKQSEECQNKERKLIYIGRLSNEKGVDLLIKSYKISGINNKLYIIGDGPEKEKLIILAKHYGLATRCIFKTWQSNIYEYMRIPNIVVVPSHCAETFNLVGREAMKQGVPVIAFGVGGILEWLKAGYNGIEIKPWDINKMAEAMKLLIDDKVLYNKLSQGALKQADKYGIEQYQKDLLNVYNEAIGAWKKEKCL